MELKIEKANLDDLRDVYGLMCELEECELDYESFAAIYRSMLEEPERYGLLAAKAEGKMIGFVDIRFERLLHHAAKVAELLELIVQPGYRSLGVGQVLFDQACLMAKERGCVQIECSSSQRRHRAHAFYVRNGMANDHFGFSLPFEME